MFQKYMTKSEWTLGRNTMLRRILVCVFGEIITAIGIAICLEGKAGVDPYTAFLQGISHISGVSFAIVVPVVNILMLVVVLPFDKSIFGLGTVLNFTVIGTFTNIFRGVYQDLFTFEYSVGGMLIHLVIGLALFCLGVSMYITCDLGQCPYDGIAPALRRKSERFSYRTYRIMQDIITIFLALALISFQWSLGIVAIGTIIMGFFTGPIVSFFNKVVSNRLVGIEGDIFEHQSGKADSSIPEVNASHEEL